MDSIKAQQNPMFKAGELSHASNYSIRYFELNSFALTRISCISTVKCHKQVTGQLVTPNTLITKRTVSLKILLPQNVCFCSVCITSHRALLMPLTMNSGNMSFQGMLQRVFLCCVLVLLGSSQIAAIPHTDDTVTECSENCHIKILHLKSHTSAMITMPVYRSVINLNFLCQVALASI